MATKYCQAQWVRDKNPRTIIEAIIQSWVSIFGTPGKFLTDNGGEFQNEKVRIMCEKWNIKIMATPANSPWSNGLSEKNVGLIKES